MIFRRTPDFVSAAAGGEDWRSAAKSVLKDLGSARHADRGYDLGFLYITDRLAEDASSILNLMRSVTGIESWTGCVGVGVFGTGEEWIDGCAISVMIARIGQKNFRTFHTDSEPERELGDNVRDWLSKQEAFLSLVHGDPLIADDPGAVMERLEALTGGFYAGGLCSSRLENVVFSDTQTIAGFSGALFSQDACVSTMLAQGCIPIGPVRTITRCDDGHTIIALDGDKPFTHFSEDIRNMAAQETGQDPDSIVIGEPFESGASWHDQEHLPPDAQPLFRGEVHVAFPVAETDTGDYLVRNIIDMDQESGAISVSQMIAQGDRIMFVRRDPRSMQVDLSRALLGLRARIEREQGRFSPRGGIYISCIGRAMGEDSITGTGEAALIREILGDIPLTGFYAGGEISNCRLYAYTGLLILFC